MQVNNWNDDRKKSLAEANYYCRILEDFELDKKQIESIKKSIDNNVKHTNELLLTLDSGNKTRNYLMNKLTSSFRREIYVPRNKTFEELIFSGNLNILSDLEIKNALIQYDSEMESNISVLLNNRDEFTKEVFKFINSSVDIGLHELDDVKKLIAPSVIELLPQDNWTKDKNNELYMNFQKVLVLNLATVSREKQLLDATLKLMESSEKLLKEKCKKF